MRSVQYLAISATVFALLGCASPADTSDSGDSSSESSSTEESATEEGVTTAIYCCAGDGCTSTKTVEVSADPPS